MSIVNAVDVLFFNVNIDILPIEIV